MHPAAVWKHSRNLNIKIVRNSIELLLWNPSDFSPDDVLSCLRIVFTNSVFQVPPSENSHVGWDLGNRMARGYQFDAKWVCPMRSYAWGIQVFCSRNEASPHFSNKSFEYLTHNLPWERLILHQTNNAWSSYSQDLNRRDYFLRGVPERQFVKTISRQERTSSGEKSDGFHNKSSMELRTVLMFKFLLYCHTAAGCMERR